MSLQRRAFMQGMATAAIGGMAHSGMAYAERVESKPGNRTLRVGNIGTGAAAPNWSP